MGDRALPTAEKDGLAVGYDVGDAGQSAYARSGDVNETKRTLAERLPLRGERLMTRAWGDAHCEGDTAIEAWLKGVSNVDCEALTTALHGAVAGWARSLGRDPCGGPLPEEPIQPDGGKVLQGDDAQCVADALDTAKESLLAAETPRQVTHAVLPVMRLMGKVIKDHGNGYVWWSLRYRDDDPSDDDSDDTPPRPESNVAPFGWVYECDEELLLKHIHNALLVSSDNTTADPTCALTELQNAVAALAELARRGREGEATP